MISGWDAAMYASTTRISNNTLREWLNMVRDERRARSYRTLAMTNPCKQLAQRIDELQRAIVENRKRGDAT